MSMIDAPAKGRFQVWQGLMVAVAALFLFAAGCETQGAKVTEAEPEMEEPAAEEKTVAAPQTVPSPPEVPEMIVVSQGPAFSAPDVAYGAEPMDFLKDRESSEYQHHIVIRTDAGGTEYRLGVLLHKGQEVTPPAVGGTRQTDIGTFRYLGERPTEEHPVRVGWLRISR